MNVEIGAEAALFPGMEYISGICLAVHNNCLKNEKDNTVQLLPLQLTVTLFLGDKNSPYYKPGSIEELANHIVRYLSGYI
jgi:hypothetical protein